MHHPPSQPDNARPKPHPHHHRRLRLLSHDAATARPRGGAAPASAWAWAWACRTLATWPAPAGRPNTADSAAAAAPPSRPVPPTCRTPPRNGQGLAQRSCPHRSPRDPRCPSLRRSPTPPATQPRDRRPDRLTTRLLGGRCRSRDLWTGCNQPRQRLQTGGGREGEAPPASPTSTAQRSMSD
jgi:hypothetical protein